jgi:hypothetical protein
METSQLLTMQQQQPGNDIKEDGFCSPTANI